MRAMGRVWPGHRIPGTPLSVPGNIVQALELEGWVYCGPGLAPPRYDLEARIGRLEDRMDDVAGGVVDFGRVRALELQVETLTKAVRSLMFPDQALR